MQISSDELFEELVEFIIYVEVGHSRWQEPLCKNPDVQDKHSVLEFMQVKQGYKHFIHIRMAPKLYP